MHEVLDANYTWRRILSLWGIAILNTGYPQSRKDILLAKSMKTTKKSSVKSVRNTWPKGWNIIAIIAIYQYGGGVYVFVEKGSLSAK